jgi:hypothetical protein
VTGSTSQPKTTIINQPFAHPFCSTPNQSFETSERDEYKVLCPLCGRAARPVLPVALQGIYPILLKFPRREPVSVLGIAIRRLSFEKLQAEWIVTPLIRAAAVPDAAVTNVWPVGAPRGAARHPRGAGPAGAQTSTEERVAESVA